MFNNAKNQNFNKYQLKKKWEWAYMLTVNHLLYKLGMLDLQHNYVYKHLVPILLYY